MTIQYYMRGYNSTAPGAVGYVNWVVNDTPDQTGTYVPAPYLTSQIQNISINRIVQSKINNFLKPVVTPTFIDGYYNNPQDGYLFHLNSYDWLQTSPNLGTTPAAGQPIGISIVRGATTSGEGWTPSIYASLFWEEGAQNWLFAFLGTNGAIDGYHQVTTGNLQVNGTLNTTSNAIIGGNLTVQGTTTTIDSTVVDIEGRVIHGNWSTTAGVTPPTAALSGFTIHRGANDSNVQNDGASIIWTEGTQTVSGSDGYWRFVTLPNDVDTGTIGSPVNSLGVQAAWHSAAASASPATTSLPTIGGFRTQNNTTAVSSVNTSFANLLLLGTSNSNKIVHGDAVNLGHTFNTATSSVFDFQVNSVSEIQLAKGTVTFSDGYENITISQIAGPNDGYSLTLQAQNGVALGGNLNLTSGTGTVAGNVLLETGGTARVTVTPTTTTITGILVNSSLGTGVLHSNSGGTFTSSLVVNADISPSAVIAVSKLAPGSDGYILQTNGTTPVWNQITGDAAISDTGVTTISSLTGVGGFVNVAATGAVINWNNTAANPGITQTSINTSGITATPMTIQAQNATGLLSTGANLILSSGTGTLHDGYVDLQVGGVTVAAAQLNKFVFEQGIRRNVTVMNAFSITDGYIQVGSDFIAVSNLNSAFTVHLPSTLTSNPSPILGDTYEIKDVSGLAATHSITIQDDSGYLIDGAASISLTQNYAYMTLIFTGSEWSIIDLGST